MLRSAMLRALPRQCARLLSGDGIFPAASRQRAAGRRWTPAEDAALSDAVVSNQAAGAKENARGMWTRVAESVGGGRTSRGCRYRYTVSLQRLGVRFSRAEDRRLLAAVEAWKASDSGGGGARRDGVIGSDGQVSSSRSGRGRVGRVGFVNWQAIALVVGGGRTGDAVRERWTERLDPRLKAGRFTRGEDEVLRDAVEKWGRDWVRAAEQLPGRSRTMCLQRWLAIEPGKREGPFSAEEDARLLEVRERLVREKSDESVTFGDVADAFGPGRNRVQCARRYSRLMTLKAKAEAKEKAEEK